MFLFSCLNLINPGLCSHTFTIESLLQTIVLKLVRNSNNCPVGLRLGYAAAHDGILAVLGLWRQYRITNSELNDDGNGSKNVTWKYISSRFFQFI